MKPAVSNTGAAVGLERQVRDSLTIAVDLYRAGDYPEALMRYGKLSDLVEELGRDIYKGKLRNGQGRCLQMIGEATGQSCHIEKALGEYGWAEHFYNQAGEPVLAAGAEANIGNALFFLNRIDEAIPYLRRAEACFLTYKAFTELAQVEETTARVLISKCEYDLAHKYAVRSAYRLQDGFELEVLKESRATLRLAVERLEKAEPIRCALVECGSVRAAAERLGMTQQGLNKAIKNHYPELEQIKVDGRRMR